MPRRKTLQTNFSAGELSPEIGMRQDTDQYQNGAASLRNMRCLISGGVTRRPGSWHLAEFAGPARIVDFVVNQTTKFILAFGDGRLDFFFESGASAGTAITGAPWTLDIVSEMDWVQSGNTMFIVHPEMPIQVITRTAATTWARTAYTFYVGPASRPEQPYLKIAPSAWTLTPSAITGSITLTLGGGATAWFVAAHVGQYIRYLSKACLITAVAANGLSCTATVIENLPITQTLTVTSSASFAIGEVVEGATSTAKGLVTAIGDSTHVTIVVIERLVPFAVESLIGPNAVTAISAVSTVSPAAVTDWDEQFFGPVFGYPACIALHRNRMLFAGHPFAPDYLIGSETNNLYSFNVGTGADADAIIESIGDAGASKIVHLHSAEQLLVLTDRGPYYCPEGQASPFRPSSMAFFPFGSPWAITQSTRSIAFDGGVLIVSGSLVIKMRPTGNLSQAWDADEVSILASHLLSNPTGMAVTSNFAGGTERYAMLVNDDGTLAAMQLVEVQKIRNFTPWDTNGTVTSVAAIGDNVFLAVTRSVGGGLRYFLELMDQEITLDCASTYDDLSLVPERYGATPVNVVTGNYHLGFYPLKISTPPSGPYTVGLNYEPEIVTLPPVIEGPDGPAAGQLMRITEARINVISSARFATNGYTLSAYQVTDDVAAAPPERNGWERFQFMGWSSVPVLTISQSDPLPLTVLAIKEEVAF